MSRFYVLNHRSSRLIDNHSYNWKNMISPLMKMWFHHIMYVALQLLGRLSCLLVMILVQNHIAQMPSRYTEKPTRITQGKHTYISNILVLNTNHILDEYVFGRTHFNKSLWLYDTALSVMVMWSISTLAYGHKNT